MPLALNASAIFEPGATGPPWAVATQANVLSNPSLPAAGRALAWSGWFDENARPEHGFFPRDFRVWTNHGWSALAAACDALEPSLTASGRQLLLRPHNRQVLSDPQACITFFRTRVHSAIRFLLDPASMLAATMVATAEDHLERIFSALGRQPFTAAILLANVRRGPFQDDDLLIPTPLRHGLIDPALLIRAWQSHCPAELPVVLLETDLDAALPAAT